MTDALQPPLSAAQADAFIFALTQLWPSVFSVYQRRRRPLAIGIDRALIAQLDPAILAEHITETDVKAALARYVNADGYLQACIAGAARVGLDGKPVGIVTEKQAQRAQALVAKRNARRRANGNSVKRVGNEYGRAGLGDAAARRVGCAKPVPQAL